MDCRRQMRRNSEEIPYYGERHRCGELISTATAEAIVSQVISRMVKKQHQPSEWTSLPDLPRGRSPSPGPKWGAGRRWPAAPCPA